MTSYLHTKAVAAKHGLDLTPNNAELVKITRERSVCQFEENCVVGGPKGKKYGGENNTHQFEYE